MDVSSEHADSLVLKRVIYVPKQDICAFLLFIWLYDTDIKLDIQMITR